MFLDNKKLAFENIEYDNWEKYRSYMLPAVNEAAEICTEYCIPFIYLAAVKNSPGGTDFHGYALLPDMVGWRLDKDMITPYAGTWQNEEHRKIIIPPDDKKNFRELPEDVQIKIQNSIRYKLEYIRHFAVMTSTPFIFMAADRNQIIPDPTLSPEAKKRLSEKKKSKKIPMIKETFYIVDHMLPDEIHLEITNNVYKDMVFRYVDHKPEPEVEIGF